MKIFPYSDEIEAMRILLETTSETKPEHIYDTLDGEGQQDNLDTEETMLQYCSVFSEHKNIK